ncbi:MAG: DNA repair protein RadA [Deinococcales bacterium]
MAKAISSYICQECGAQSPVMMGKCPRCGSWNSMEAKQEGTSSKTRRRASLEALSLAEVAEQGQIRQATGIDEVDRVLGGGWVDGAVLLLAGEPGIGKSTLLLQLADEAIKRGRDTLYVAGEESPGQVKMRAARLNVSNELKLTRETAAEVIAEHIRQEKPKLIIVDSIQTLTVHDESVPGSLTQVRDSTALLTQAAKEVSSTLVLIGHITKQGSIAGPKVIEHMVDATLALESASGFRVLRSMKNRFGAAGEMGVFEMTAEGMKAVANPSEVFLAERPKGVPGSVVAASLEGQRPLLLEVQALAAKSPYASPRRIVQGLDPRRVDVVLAVLERRLELPLAGLDVYVNVAGGLRLTDPGTDLAVALAVYSAVTNRPVPEESVLVGEVGLAGELRSVPQLARRAYEAERSSFKHFISPQALEPSESKLTSKLKVYAVKSLSGALAAVWEH